MFFKYRIIIEIIWEKIKEDMKESIESIIVKKSIVHPKEKRVIPLDLTKEVENQVNIIRKGSQVPQNIIIRKDQEVVQVIRTSTIGNIVIKMLNLRNI